MASLGELIHYDIITRSHPEWLAAINQLMLGKPGLFERLVRVIRPTMPVAANFLVASARYRVEGQQVFCVGPRFRHLLHETECDSVPKETLRLPYPCFYIVLPDCPWRLWGGMDTGMHQIGGGYLYENGPDALGVLIWAKANERSRAVDDDSSFSMTFHFSDLVVRADDPTCYDVEKYLTTILSDPRRENSDIGLSVTEASKVEMEEHTQSIHSVVRVFLNLVLYLNSVNAETGRENSNVEGLRKALARTGKPKKRRKLAREINQAATQVTWVGHSFERQEEDPHRSEPGGGTWAYRRGHFSHFWTGPRHDSGGNPQKGTERIVRWVKPVRRDQAAVVASQVRVHKVRGDGV